MNIDITKGDINEHLWFQRMLEARLHTETLRRAIEAGHVPPGTGELWCFEVASDCPHASANVYYAVREPHRRQDIKTFTESYTLAEALRLAMTETP